MEKIKVVVVDDHPMVIEGMRAMLAQISVADLIATAGDAYQTLELLKNLAADIVITDINLPEVSGIELVAKIKKEFPQLKLIVMSTFSERSYISQAIQNGADGYLVKSASREEIEEALLSVLEGKMYMSVDLKMSNDEKKELKTVPALSRREKEVLLLIAEGLSNPQIAGKLFISLHTVDTHRKNLLTKFNTNNTASLIRLAAKGGLL